MWNSWREFKIWIFAGGRAFAGDLLRVGDVAESAEWPDAEWKQSTAKKQQSVDEEQREHTGKYFLIIKFVQKNGILDQRLIA